MSVRMIPRRCGAVQRARMFCRGHGVVQRYILRRNRLRYFLDTPYRGVGYANPYRGHRSLDLQNPSSAGSEGIFRTSLYMHNFYTFTTLLPIFLIYFMCT